MCSLFCPTRLCLSPRGEKLPSPVQTCFTANALWFPGEVCSHMLTQPHPGAATLVCVPSYSPSPGPPFRGLLLRGLNGGPFFYLDSVPFYSSPYPDPEVREEAGAFSSEMISLFYIASIWPLPAAVPREETEHQGAGTSLCLLLVTDLGVLCTSQKVMGN